MKVQFLLPLTVMVSVTLLGIIKMRKREQEKDDKQRRFQAIKLRVTHDVLGEYMNEKAEMQNRMDKAEANRKALMEEMVLLQTQADKTKTLLDVCKGEQKSDRDKLASAESELTKVQDDVKQEMTSWKTEEAALGQQLAERSLVCDFVNKESLEARNLCDGMAVGGAAKGEEPKAEAPKQEEPKVEAPKQEEPKAEEPKAEEPKAEEPKAEAPKQEEPKQEEPKQEEPKQEEPKQEKPKAEEPKAEAPKQEEPKAEEPKAEAPKQEKPKAEAPKQEKPKAEEPKAEAPKQEQPKA